MRLYEVAGIIFLFAGPTEHYKSLSYENNRNVLALLVV